MIIDDQSLKAAASAALPSSAFFSGKCFSFKSLAMATPFAMFSAEVASYAFSYASFPTFSAPSLI